MTLDDLGSCFDGHGGWTDDEIKSATKLAKKLSKYGKGRDRVGTCFSDIDTGFFIGPKNIADDNVEDFIKIEKTICDSKRRELYKPCGQNIVYVIVNNKLDVKPFNGKVLTGFYLITPSKWKDANGEDAFMGYGHSDCIFLTIEDAVRAACMALDALRRGMRWGEDTGG